MNWKKSIGLSILFALIAYNFIGERFPESKSAALKTSFANRKAASVPKLIIEPKIAESELVKSGLASAKVAAINQLYEFHNSRPAFTEENFIKRQAMLQVLVKNPKETVEIFSKIMRTSKDDSLKSFLLNLTMNSSLEEDEKAEIFVARLSVGAAFSKDGLVPDEQMSFMIGVSHLSRLENNEVKHHALNELKNNTVLVESAAFREIYRDYFKETF
jgi:hypothetical protein